MQHGYYPRDPLQAAQCDELIEAVKDVHPKIFPHHFKDPSERDTSDLFNNTLPKYLKVWDTQIGNKKYLVGDSWTIADFMVGSLYTDYFTNPDVYETENWAKVLSQFPNFKRYGEGFAAANADYLAERASRPL